MVVFRSTALLICLLLALSGVHAVNTKHNTQHGSMLRLKREVATSKPAPKAAVTPAPAQFKQQAKAEVGTESALKAKVARSEADLEHETKLLDMQKQESELLLKLKEEHLARESAERSLVRQKLVIAQRQAAALVDDLANLSKNRMLAKLQQLNDVITSVFGPNKNAKPASIAIDSKFTQKKADPAAADPATPTSGVESDAKKKLHKQILAKATDVVNAQLDGILNSEELAYIKAHNELGDTDQSATQDGEIVEEDHGARPGETPDEHYKRLSKEADALMAKAYPFIRCEVDQGSASGGTGGHASGGTAGSGAGTGGSGDSTKTESSTGESTGATGGSGGSGESGTTGTAGTGNTASEGTAAAGASGATAAGGAATAAAGGAATAGETAAAGATAGATAGETGSSTA